MKAILKSNRSVSFSLKAAIFIAVILTVASFYLSVKLSNKESFSKLKFSEKIIAPECTVNGRFFKDIVTVKLVSTDLEASIYYTLDGSSPSLASMRYQQPIVISDKSGTNNYLSAIPTSPRWKPPVNEVFKGTVLRAISVNKRNEKSRDMVSTFFVNEKSVKRYTLPVIAITVDQKDLFGFSKGIYMLGNNYMDKDNYIRKSIPLDLPWWEYPANYLMRGSNAEREAHLEFFQPDGSLGFEANAGLRIHGNATRGFAQKSLRVCFREKYGQARLLYDLFDNKVALYSSFILRNSGNDWNKTMFRDALMQSLMKDSYLDIQDYRPSIVFINGEYWGIHNIRERFDENYLAHKYNLNRDSVTILELSGKLVQGNKEEEQSFSALLDFVKKNDLSDDKNYSYVTSHIDVKSFSDFVIANVYYCNSDWPNNNVKFWKCNSNSDSLCPGDGRWRWMLYDTDWGFGYNALSTPGSDLLSKATKVGSVGTLFGALIKNKVFVSDFLDRFQVHLNTTFNSTEVIKKVDELQQVLSPEMQEHINRWRAIESYADWLSNVETLRIFARQRPQFQADQLNAFFNLKGNAQITLKNSGKAY